MVSNELRTRIITGTILVVGFLAFDLLAIYLSFGRILLGLVGLAAAGVCAYEVGTFTFRSRSDLQYTSAAAFFLAPLFVFFSRLGCSDMTTAGCGSVSFAGSVAAAAAVLFVLVSMIARSSLSTMMQAVSTCLLGFLLIGVGGAAFISISLSLYGGLYIAWLVIVVALTDIAAFGFGRLIGGPKLAPAISPGKTVSGAVGGMLAGALAGGAFRALLAPEISWVFSILLAMLVSVAAQNGDLMKSILKRLWGVKDSGSILPGHGGVLDRVDGMLGGALVLFAVLHCGFFNQQ